MIGLLTISIVRVRAMRNAFSLACRCDEQLPLKILSLLRVYVAPFPAYVYVVGFSVCAVLYVWRR